MVVDAFLLVSLFVFSVDFFLQGEVLYFISPPPPTTISVLLFVVNNEV